MKKKVLFSATVDSHILHFHVPYLKLFKEKGYEVHVATNGNEKIPYCDKKHIISFERSPYKLNNLKAIKQLKKIIDEENFEIIHTHTPMGSVVTRLASIKARKKGTRVIYTAHGFHFYKGAPKLNWLLFYPVEKILSRYTDCLITINKEDYELAKNKFKKCKQIEYVPGVGIDEEKFNFKMTQKEKNDLRKSLGLKKDDFVLIYPAELSERKRQEWLINSLNNLMNKHNNIHLLLPGKDSLNGKLEKLIENLKLENQVHLLGYRKDISKLLYISDIAVSSARQEGLPVNIMEAMYVGLPIVASNCRGNRDLVKNSKNGYLINLEDNKNFSKKVEKLYKDKKQYKGFKKYNENEIKQYKLENIVMIMEKIYFNNKIYLIIPGNDDQNRGDQALVWETKRIAEKAGYIGKYFMLADEEKSVQSTNNNITSLRGILLHPSRKFKYNHNISYNIIIFIKWGSIAVLDFLKSLFYLNSITINLVYFFSSKEKRKVIDVIKSSEIVFVKGGGFIHDYGGIISLYRNYYMLYHIKLALKFNKKVIIMPNSYGPFTGYFASMLIKNTLKKCQLVLARESVSQQKLKDELNINSILISDLGFFLESKKTNIDTIFSVKQKNVALTVRPYRFPEHSNGNELYKKYISNFANVVKWLAENNYNPIFVEQVYNYSEHEQDMKAIKDILCILKKQHIKVAVISNLDLDCMNLKYIYSKFDYIIGTRFHSIIFSLSEGVPAIAITYGGNKGLGIMKDLNLENFVVPIDLFTSDEVIKKFKKLTETKIDFDILNKKLKKDEEKLIEKLKEVKY